MTIDSKALEAGKALEIIRDVAYTTALKHREEGRHVLADKIDAALEALPSPKVEGEPVAWRWCHESDKWETTTKKWIAEYAVIQGCTVEPLYASPSPVLADEGVTAEVKRLRDALKTIENAGAGSIWLRDRGYLFARAALQETSPTPPAITP